MGYEKISQGARLGHGCATGHPGNMREMSGHFILWMGFEGTREISLKLTIMTLILSENNGGMAN
jgi:hypothetical protein